MNESKPVDLEVIQGRLTAIEPFGLSDEWEAEIWEENEPQAPDCWIIYGGDKSPEASIANVCGGNQDPEAVAKFIAHARQDIPALISEVESLRERVKELEGHPVILDAGALFGSFQIAVNALDAIAESNLDNVKDFWRCVAYAKEALKSVAFARQAKEPTKGDQP